MPRETHTVETQYGSVDVETYDCDSCGNTVAYEETVKFTIGNREGRACPTCEDVGPVSFPEKAVEFSMPSQITTDRHGNEEEHGFFSNLILSPILFIMVPFTFADDVNDFMEGYATAVIAVLLWIVAPLVYLFVL